MSIPIISASNPDTQTLWHLSLIHVTRFWVQIQTSDQDQPLSPAEAVLVRGHGRARGGYQQLGAVRAELGLWRFGGGGGVEEGEDQDGGVILSKLHHG